MLVKWGGGRITPWFHLSVSRYVFSPLLSYRRTELPINPLKHCAFSNIHEFAHSRFPWHKCPSPICVSAKFLTLHIIPTSIILFIIKHILYLSICLLYQLNYEIYEDRSHVLLSHRSNPSTSFVIQQMFVNYVYLSSWLMCELLEYSDFIITTSGWLGPSTDPGTYQEYISWIGLT